MLLSDAVILGDSLKKPDAGVWLTPDGTCGCAFGGALLACGITANQLYSEIEFAFEKDIAEMASVRRLWPWITEEILCNISLMYRYVVKGRSTIEDIAAYIRTMEPPEVEQAEIEHAHAEIS